MPHGYLKRATKGEISRRKMRGGGSGKSNASAHLRRMKEIKLGADGFKKGSRGHGGKGAFERDLIEEVQWSKHTANTSQTVRNECGFAQLRDSAARESVDVTPGSHVRFEAEPGVLVDGVITDKLGGDFVVEVEGGITIPGVRREQLHLSPVCTKALGTVTGHSTDSFVFVSAPLARAESVGAPLPRTERLDAADPNSPEVTDLSAQTLTWASHASAKQTPQPAPSFQALQAEEEAKQSAKQSVADIASAKQAASPNPRVVRGLQAMGFDEQLCAEAALCTGNESIEKAARWVVDALDPHEPARNELSGTSELATSVQEVPVAIGFVDKLAATLISSRPQADIVVEQTNAADEANEDGWEVVSAEVKE
jgi:hypothetical protein